MDSMNRVGCCSRHHPLRAGLLARLVSEPLHVVGAFLVYLLLVSTSLTLAASEMTSPNPYSYTKLRHDLYFLAMSRSYQHAETWREKPLKLVIKDEPNKQNKTIQYHMNDKVDLNKIDEDEFLFEALHQTYLSRLIQPKMMDYDKPGDMEAAISPSVVDPGRCARELAYLGSKLHRIDEAHAGGRAAAGISPELANFLEATSPEEFGVYMGNYYWPGNWRTCMTAHVLDPLAEEPVSFKGRHCVASLRSPKWTPLIEKNLEQLQKRKYFKYPEQPDEYRRFFRIQVGFCLPQSCHSNSLQAHRELIKRLASRRLQFPRQDYPIANLYCLPDEDSPLRKPDLSGSILLICILIWVCAIVIATIADLRGWNAPESVHERSLVDKLVVILSMRESWRTLIRQPRRAETKATAAGNLSKQQVDERTNGRYDVPIAGQVSIQDVRFLDAFKVIMMVFILVAHVGMFNHIYSRFPIDFYVAPMWYYHVVTSSTFQVDWFFCMTGLIVTYISFATRAVWKNPTGAWIYSMFHRYWRLAPCYLLLFWFCRSLFVFTGSGALWDYGTSNMSVRAICKRESWLKPITMTQNMHALHDECIIPAWYIANDLQYYIITPPLLILLSQKALAGWLVILGMMFSSVAARFYGYMINPRSQFLEMMRPRMDIVMRNNWDAHELYLKPQYRIAPYLVGILAGHHVYMVRSGKWRSPLIGPHGAIWRSLLAWTGVSMCMSVQFITGLLDLYPRALEPFAKWAASIAYSGSHMYAGFGPAFVFTAILLGQWPAIKLFFEKPIFIYLSRINYLVYLCQVEVIVYLIQINGSQIGMAFPEQLRLLAFSAAVLYPLAFVGTLVFANPLAKFESEFVGSLFMPRKPPQELDTDKSQDCQLQQVASPDTGESARLVQSRPESVAVVERSTMT